MANYNVINKRDVWRKNKCFLIQLFHAFYALNYVDELYTFEFS